MQEPRIIMMFKDISQIRTDINDIDDKLLELLSRRTQLILDVANFKYHNDKKVKDEQREEAHLNSLMTKASELGVSPKLINEIYTAIYDDSCSKQLSYINAMRAKNNQESDLKVAFLGEKGTYSYLATYKYFHAYKEHIIEKNCTSFNEIVAAVENNEVDCALLPIENTSSGCINEVYDLLQDAKIKIIGELTYPIEHCILSKNKNIDLANVKTVYGHAQPISQCSTWLNKNFKDVKIIPVSSSSEAMTKAYEDTTGTVVAIGCEESGLIYNLNAIQKNIANQKHNITRFIVVGKQEICVPNDALAKTSIIFSTENKPGALVNVLNVFSKHNINICKLQSRPRSPNDTKNNAIWAETFYADIQINTNSILMQNILKELQSFTGFVKILGCYEQNTQK